ncbi:hypothetical protein BV25DRAFT_509292 [Artomyces pyxidatus]|uniref:Uncharacterized protein n=1 Tax=Artomyces pyxidatus TaxID=48021 RepID=A0ACB8TI26_9AGAM|nr:hypothetical protein BV25DRAFT_509292 [Artomyces pyxidatus]
MPQAVPPSLCIRPPPIVTDSREIHACQDPFLRLRRHGDCLGLHTRCTGRDCSVTHGERLTSLGLLSCNLTGVSLRDAVSAGILSRILHVTLPLRHGLRSTPFQNISLCCRDHLISGSNSISCKTRGLIILWTEPNNGESSGQVLAGADSPRLQSRSASSATLIMVCLPQPRAMYEDVSAARLGHVVKSPRVDLPPGRRVVRLNHA